MDSHKGAAMTEQWPVLSTVDPQAIFMARNNNDIIDVHGAPAPAVMVTAAPAKMTFVYRLVLAKRFQVVQLGDEEFLVGVHVANFLGRETFNLYRSLKVKNIECIRCTQEQVERAIDIGVVRRGTRSVTLLRYVSIVEWLHAEVLKPPHDKFGRRLAARSKDGMEDIDNGSHSVVDVAEDSTGDNNTTSSWLAVIDQDLSDDGAPLRHTIEPWEILVSLHECAAAPRVHQRHHQPNKRKSAAPVRSICNKKQPNVSA